ncbi:tryptophan--tRNA ligase [Helicobacter sp. 13S00401-1]|uniref:tryptophan--tRNA ligase n=1 Tax=Helicobacter sp. 13S00401-1 TaxID=1905758 RepID=UPI000BA767A5|nr:tryptophan--tRNA ligase [Helicobacter sp. 13S00401-1]PAF49679.1 tryptophan--tRNA ligase [Helicobacter sp. 13S00401-1]
MNKQAKKQRVFSGIQPTGDIHLGNYLGAIKNWVDSQDLYDNIYCIVNSHAITVYQDPKILETKTFELCAMLLACGIDTKKSKLFIQSTIDAHPALSWILDCNIPMGEMNRMTQFKDKSAKNPKDINVGLFNYPALMAADILLYDTNLVPVGDDQKQHLELARNVAQRFNERYGECFVVPEPMIPKVGARVMALDDPTSKMSKSSKSKYNSISLLDSDDDIVKKIKKATTDDKGFLAFDETRPGIYNLLCIYEALSGEKREEIVLNFPNYGKFKEALSQKIIDRLLPIREEYFRLINDKAYLEKVLYQSQAEVESIANETYKRAKALVGLI